MPNTLLCFAFVLGLQRPTLFIKANICSNHNEAARVQNSLLESATDDLFPLNNPSIEVIIHRFSAKPQDLVNMAREDLDALIDQFGVTPGGREAQKRSRLRVEIGLKKVQRAAP